MTDLRRRLRDADALSTPDLWGEATRRAADPGGLRPSPEGPRAGRIVAAVVAFTLFVGGSLLAARVFLGGEPSPTRPRTADAWPEVPAGWTELAPPPFERSDAAVAWTGSELFLWGGGTDYNANFFSDGALYDPETNRWHTIADGPLEARAEADAAWTGSEVLVWGGYGRRGRLRDGAAYDPSSDVWRGIPPFPIELGPPAAHVWTGSELIVLSELGDYSPEEGPKTWGAAYDPAEDSWRTIPSAPPLLNAASGLWTGSEAIFYGSDLNSRNRSAFRWAQGMAYDPSANVWRVLPERHISPQASWVNWTGTEMLVWDYNTDSALYDPITDSWREPNPMPIEFSECYPNSVRTTTSVFAWFCGQMASFDIEADAWEAVESGPVERSRNDPNRLGLPVGAGDVVVMLLRSDAKCCELDEMWAYRGG